MKKIIILSTVLITNLAMSQPESQNLGKCPVIHGGNSSDTGKNPHLTDQSSTKINPQSSTITNPHQIEKKQISGNKNQEWWPN